MQEPSVIEQLKKKPPWDRLNLLWKAHLNGELNKDDDPSWAVRYGYTSDLSPMRREKFWRELISRYGLRMTHQEETLFADLPDQFTVYRGYCADNGFEDGFSWALDRAVAEQFATGHCIQSPELFTEPTIAELVIDKAQVVAFIKGEEDEIVLMPNLE